MRNVANFVKKMYFFLLPGLLLFVFNSCGNKMGPFMEAKTFAGGIKVSPQTLNHGRQIYTNYCFQCHGKNGDGKGPASKGLVPPPRNFTLGVYKFASVLVGDLPHDEDFYEILKKGLHGTAMLPWDLTENQLFAVVQYIKTFAPKVWEAKGAKLGEKITVPKDPYTLAHKSSAIEHGKYVYHVVAQCTICHRGYATREEIYLMSKKSDSLITEFEDDYYDGKLQEYDQGYKVLPPDFTWDEVRSAQTVEELFLRIAAGVGGGSTMPSWKETITDNEIWAVSYYVKSLMELRNKPERKYWMDRVKNQPPFSINKIENRKKGS